MSVGLLIISHDGIGPALLGTAALMLDGCPLKAKLLTASRESDPEELMANAEDLIESLDEGDGVLILTDLYGSTPSNVARKLASRYNVRIVTGLNLPMLLRVLNYPRLGLVALADKALSGGRDGVILATPAED